MAAPTPISALVHSSTLVTAGLYLIIRFRFIIYVYEFASFVMVLLGLYTSFYAGLSALVEKDLKKIVALSTLSHLGFICLALFSGSLYLSFIHLISHALFKSLLFISVGEIIYLNSHSQESRIISSSRIVSTHSSYFMVFSVFNLFGWPFLRGFYSKDLVLEIISYSRTSVFIVAIIYVNVFFTYMYRINIFKAVLSYSNSWVLGLVELRSLVASAVISLLGLTRVIAVRIII